MFSAAFNTFTSIAIRSVQAEQNFLEHVFEAVYESSVRSTLKGINEPIDLSRVTISERPMQHV
jgi:hypothetical protein